MANCFKKTTEIGINYLFLGGLLLSTLPGLNSIISALFYLTTRKKEGRDDLICERNFKIRDLEKDLKYTG